jgi:hypothetical protein
VLATPGAQSIREPPWTNFERFPPLSALPDWAVPTGAAHAQGCTPQTVSKAIRQLEEHPDVRLFHRTTRKSALTDDGARLLSSVRAAMSRVRSASCEDEGPIRISAGGAA